MKFRIVFSTLIIATFLLSCKKNKVEDKAQTSHLGIQLVTGVALADNNGNPIGQVGNPNIKKLDVHVYPNPSNGITSQSAQATLAHYWLVPGVKNTTFESIDFQTELNNHTYADADLDNLAVLSGALNVDNLTHDFTSVTTGYYRLFYRMNSGSLGWHNLYIEPGNPTPQINW